jgi:methyl-accepting chemotaxis protein
VKELETKAQFYNQMAHSLGQIGGSLESIIKNSGSFESAEMRFRADIAQANVEALRSYLQMLNAEMGTSDSAYRDASQQINQALDLCRQALNALQALRDAIMRNI